MRKNKNRFKYQPSEQEKRLAEEFKNMARVDKLSSEHATFFTEAVWVIFDKAFRHGYKHGREDCETKNNEKV